MEPTGDTAWVTKEQRLDSPETYGKTKYYWFFKSNNKIIPNDILLYL